MKARWFRTMGLGIVIAAVFGCASTAPRVDPDYFSPYEAAHRSAAMTPQSTQALYTTIRDLEIQRFIPPGGTVEGYVYTHLDEGINRQTADTHRRRRGVEMAVAV